MNLWLIGLSSFLFASVVGLIVWRNLDRHADERAWRALAATQAGSSPRFDAASIAHLPEPAQRYFKFTIAAGAPLRTVVEIDMTGRLGLGTREAPNYKPMHARQILAPPHGLVWSLTSGPISGSDGALPASSWTRFWLFGLLPIVRAGGPDHRRSAFGRVVAEAVFWAPAGLLPGEHTRWESIDEHRARAVVTNGEFEQAVEITVDREGAPRRVLMQRWSNENPSRVYREQPFGGEMSDYRWFGHYRLPTHVDGGNHFGTPEYFPFFQAHVLDIRFPDPAARP